MTSSNIVCVFDSPQYSLERVECTSVALVLVL